MKWFKEKPTVDGYYWMRGSKMSPYEQLEVVEIEIYPAKRDEVDEWYFPYHNEEEEIWMRFCGSDYDRNLNSEYDRKDLGEFELYGPLEIPK